MIAVHPGEVIREMLTEREMSQTDLARRTGMSIKHINGIVMGHVRLTGRTAVLIAYELKVSPRLLARMQADFDVSRAVAAIRADVADDVFGRDLRRALDGWMSQL